MNKFMLCEIEQLLKKYSVSSYLVDQSEGNIYLIIEFSNDLSKGGNE